MAADAGLRRLGGALLALQHDTHARDGLGPDGWAAWRAWVPEALERLAASDCGPAAAPPPAPPTGTLARIGRVVEVLGDIVAGREDPAPDVTVATAGSAHR